MNIETAETILLKYWGYSEIKPSQADVINNLIDGRDCLAILPTGSGKSITYQIPSLMKEGFCVVVTPLLALMEDQVRDLKSRNIKAIALSGSQNIDEMIRIFDLFRHGEYKFLYLAPERLNQNLVIDFLRKAKVNLWAIDEAHCIAQWGFNFRPSYQKLAILRDLHPAIPILALTATATEQITTEIIQALRLKSPELISRPMIRHNIEIHIEKREDKTDRIQAIAKAQNSNGIIYVPSRKLSENLANTLSSSGLECTFFHGGMDQKQKQKALDEWIKNPRQIMVATNAFGMGINHPRVRFVIHTHIPDSIESYVQEMGRAGRDGMKAQAWLIYQQNDLDQFNRRKKGQRINQSQLTKFYRHLNNYFQIAYAEGKGQTFGLQLSNFCTVYHLNPLQSLAALNMLDRLAVIQLKRQLGIKTKLRFVVKNEEVNQVFETNEIVGLVGRNILRLYGGIFQNKIGIDLNRLARKTGIPVSKVRDAITWMEKQAMIEQEEFQTDLQITLLVPREDDRTIIPYAQIIDRYAQRIIEQQKNIIQLVLLKDQCIKKCISQYFGQILTSDCGMCSICLGKKQCIDLTSADAIAVIIMSLLKDQSLTLSELRENITFDPADVDAVLTHLCDNNQIGIDAVNRYFIHP